MLNVAQGRGGWCNKVENFKSVKLKQGHNLFVMKKWEPLPTFFADWDADAEYQNILTPKSWLYQLGMGGAELFPAGRGEKPRKSTDPKSA